MHHHSAIPPLRKSHRLDGFITEDAGSRIKKNNEGGSY